MLLAGFACDVISGLLKARQISNKKQKGIIGKKDY